MTQVNILSLSKEKIEFLLTNHELFDSDEVKIAAKLLVQDNFESKLVSYDNSLSRYQRDVMAQQQGINSYCNGIYRVSEDPQSMHYKSRIFGGLL